MSPRNSATSKKRFTLWLHDDMVSELEKIQQNTGKESIAEVIREAVTVYRDLLKARDNGVDLFFEHSKSGKQGPIWILPGPPPTKKQKRK